MSEAPSTGSLRLKRYWPVLLIWALGFPISGALSWRLSRQAVEQDRRRLERTANLVMDGLNSRLQTTDLILRSGEDFFGSQETITAGAFRDWCMKYGWSITAPWISGVSLWTNSNAGKWRESIPADPAQWSDQQAKAFVGRATAAEAEFDFAFGYCSDITNSWITTLSGKMSRRWKASPSPGEIWTELSTAVTYNTPQTTTRQKMIQRTNGKATSTAVLGVPVFEPGHGDLKEAFLRKLPGGDTSSFNFNLCRGMLLAAIDYDRLETAVLSPDGEKVGLEMFASDPPQKEQWLDAGNDSPRAVDSKFKPYLASTFPWKLYNRRFSLYVYTLPTFERTPRSMSLVTAAAGSGMTLLAGALLGVTIRARGRQERMTQQIKEARDALTVAQRERERLSHNLHDNAIQTLYAIQLRLSRVASSAQTDQARAAELAQVRNQLDEVIAEVRAFILAEERKGEPIELCSVLEGITNRAQAGTTAKLQLECQSSASSQLSGSQSVQLANIAREAVSNSLRHGKPQSVLVRLQPNAAGISLEIVDDGSGFDARSPGRTGLGLTTMAARARDIGAVFQIESEPGQGTKISVKLDTRANEAAASVKSSKLVKTETR